MWSEVHPRRPAGLLFAAIMVWGCADQASVGVAERIGSTAPESATHWACTPSQCTRWIAPNSGGHGAINGSGLAPGSRVCLQPGRFSSIGVDNVSGTAEQPIEITNCGGAVVVGDAMGNTSSGIQFRNSRHFRLIGTGALGTTYGIKVEGTQTQGVSVYNGSTDIEIAYVEVTRTGFAGIMTKSDPGCNGEYARGTFTQRNTHLHHNWIHDTYSEGFYVGHSFYYGFTKQCPDKSFYVYPHELVGVHIHDNLIERTGADGLQLGCAVADVEVHHNVIDRYALDPFQPWQDNGIQIGAGTTGNWYSNIVKHGTGEGNSIIIHGLGAITVFNNVVEDTGGVYLHKDIPASAEVALLNNTFVGTRARGFQSATSSAAIKIHNNIMVHVAGVIPVQGGSNVISSHNLFTTDINVPMFVNPWAGDYHLQAGSPARNAGLDVSTYLTTDFDGAPRNDGAFDIGAFEYAANAAFSQDFSCCSSVDAYVNVSSPSNSQFNDISREANGGAWSIQGQRLQLARTGSGATDNDAGLARWTDLASSPSEMYFRFDIGVSTWTNSTFQNDAFCLDVGNFSGWIDYGTAGALGNVFNTLCIDGEGAGGGAHNRFSLNTAGLNAGLYTANGTLYRISYFLNRSTSATSYRGPDGAMHGLQPNRVAVWVENTLLFDDQAASHGSNSALTDFRMRWSQPDNGTWVLDNIVIEMALPR
jgi:hypothetical protein